MATTNIMAYYLGWKLINHLLRNTEYTPPANVYAALYNAAGTEISGNNYSRVECPTFTVSGNTATALELEFNSATGSWGTITHIAIMDSSSSGNMLFYIPLSEQQTINTGEKLVFSSLSLTLSGDENGGWGAGATTDILKFVLNNESYSTPGESVYLALGRGVVTDGDYNFTSWSEITGAGYARKRVGGTSYWGAGGLDQDSGYSPLYNGTYSENISEIIFTEDATGNWGTVVNIAFFTSTSAGNPFLWGKLASSKYVMMGDGLKFAVNKIVLHLY